MENILGRIQFKEYLTRLLGITIIGKVCIPIAILLILLITLWQVASAVNATFEPAIIVIKSQLAQVQFDICAIRKEASRLADEVNKIKNTTTQVTGQVKKSVEPIRKSLLGLSSALKAISKTMEHILNAIIKIVRKVPFAKKIQPVNLPDIKVPGLKLPDINVDLNLEPDLSAVKNLGVISNQIATDVEAKIDELAEKISSWWEKMVMVFKLTILWIVLSLTGYIARAWSRLRIGWQMVLGHPQVHGLQYL